ncbi:nucleotidyltransferase family protein [Aestuariivita sp.]|jgi:MurNAc alpha-1-phosphate uridylyltransferase|uniref:nucleotidyltransferase family protein n=1 Tax=Aestuariivita sp. TaxID=1872407 RepID=UPI00216C6FE8|nr:nucleotidyltransferase family protein [Aestuariivita sp.]MCE8005535.1 nucleotidyltransferase family protein [Aestuariivita sp.]
MTDAVMIFGAGFGKRMGALTQHTPKPLIDVAGRSLIDRALDWTADAALRRVVVNTHFRADQIEAHLAEKDVLISHEAPEILDTGGGLRAALPLLETNPVLTLNPDVIWLGPNPLNILRNAWRPDQMDALLLCIPLDRTHGRIGGGDFSADDQGHVVRGGDLVYGGAQIIRTDLLQDVAEDAFSLNVIWDRMAQAGRLRTTLYPGAWCDVGRPENIGLAERLLDPARV